MEKVKTSVVHTTESVSGREYPLTITRQVGYQEILINGERVPVESLTIFDSPLGQSRCYTRWHPQASPEVREENLQRVRQVATQAMIDQGIW